MRTVAATPLQRRVLECAAEIAGGIPQLCERLEVSEPELHRWLSQEEVCPLAPFLKAVDIIVESERGFAAIFSVEPPKDDDPGR